jgi:hypothetical protein
LAFHFFFQDSEHIGEIFQDQENMAAILMRRHENNGDLLMVSFVNKAKNFYWKQYRTATSTALFKKRFISRTKL